MTQHYTKNTLSAAKWCGKCGKTTQHRVTGGRVGSCEECMARLEREHQNQPAPAAVQNGFNFDNEG